MIVQFSASSTSHASIREKISDLIILNTDPRGVIGDDGLAAKLLRLLINAAAFLETDLQAAKACIEEASALLAAGSESSDASQTVASARHTLAPWLARRLRTHIDANLDQPIHISDLAGFTDLSASYFFRAFKGSFGMPPHSYIVRCRLERAQRLLLSTDDPICQIALACGLSDQAHFSRLFRQQTGQSPGVWRRQRRGGLVRSCSEPS
jgi:AraC-like DNA-binding protein